MRGCAGGLAGVAVNVDNPGHHVLRDPGGDVSMDNHRGFLIHPGAVISGVALDFYGHWNPEPASDRMSTTGIENSPAFLIALGIQCLWDEGQLGEDSDVRSELQELGDQYPGSWLKYLADDTIAKSISPDRTSCRICDSCPSCAPGY